MMVRNSTKVCVGSFTMGRQVITRKAFDQNIQERKGIVLFYFHGEFNLDMLVTKVSLKGLERTETT